MDKPFEVYSLNRIFSNKKNPTFLCYNMDVCQNMPNARIQTQKNVCRILSFIRNFRKDKSNPS